MTWLPLHNSSGVELHSRHFVDLAVGKLLMNTLKSVGSTEPVRFVLELNAGVTEKFGIDENSRLVWNGGQQDDE